VSSQPIETFNIGFDVAAYNESEYATKVAEHLKTNHHLLLVTDKEAKSNIEHIVDFYDEPFAVPSVIPSSILSQKSFGGTSGIKIAASLLGTLNNKSKRAARVMDIPDFSNSWLHILSQEQYMFTEKEIGELFSEPYKHQSTLKNWTTIDALPIHPFEKISLFDIQNYLATDLLHKVDIASMSHGLELRVPFLDHNLIEFAINLPVDLKIKKGEQKYLLKKLLSNYLPEELVYRQKWGFPAPVGDWLLNDLAYLIDKYLNKQIIEQIGLFDYRFVEKLVNEFRNGADYHFKRIWALIIFNMWYNKWM
jgi:asparagine synthase (glutamine-hydrolysing)